MREKNGKNAAEWKNASRNRAILHLADLPLSTPPIHHSPFSTPPINLSPLSPPHIHHSPLSTPSIHQSPPSTPPNYPYSSFSP